jgi:hypothetical protein
MVQKGSAGRHQEGDSGINGSPTCGPMKTRRPAGRTGLGDVAGPGAFGDYRENGKNRRMPLRVPVVVRVLGRQVHRLGSPPRRHRTVGARPQPRRDGTGIFRRLRCQAPRALQGRLSDTRRSLSTRRTISPSSVVFDDGVEMVGGQPQRQRNPVRRHEGTHVRQPRQDLSAYAHRRELGRRQVHRRGVVALYKGKPHEGHKHNFYRCIREGGLPVSDVYTHVQAMNSCHLCAIAARLNRKIQWDPSQEKIVGDAEAAAFFARVPRKGFEIPRV